MLNLNVYMSFLLALLILYVEYSHAVARSNFALTSLAQLPSAFSGIFLPNIKSSTADFSGAWLIQAFPRLLEAQKELSIVDNMLGVSLRIARTNCATCAGVVTRDYLDFFVEHLSSTTNQMPNSDPRLFREAEMRLNHTTALLQAPLQNRQNQDSRQQQTLAVMIFNSMAFSVHTSIKVQSDIRRPFFATSFYSVYRFYETVIVFVDNSKDRDLLLSLRLPIWKIVVLPTPPDDLGYATLLPRAAMMHLIERHNASDAAFEKFKYIFYSEGDLVLHMRHQKELYDLIDDSDGGFAIIPHRMNTLPLVQDFSMALQPIFSSDISMNIPNVELVHEDMYDVRGSCCDDGRYEVAPCRGWWFQCPEWGLKDMMPWLKFGNYGFPVPPATEHRSKCVYSPHKHICDAPSDCTQQPSPKRTSPQQPALSKKDICLHSPKIQYLGPHPDAPKTDHNITDSLAERAHLARELASSEKELQLLLRDVGKLRKYIRQTRSQLRTAYIARA